MKRKIADALKTYKKDVYKVEHDPEELRSLTREALNFTEATLDNSYHYHFHKLPDATRADMINMINNYTLEALLPPIVEKISKRQLMLERKLELLVHLLEEALQSLDSEEGK